jgi:hypothetical protein
MQEIRGNHAKKLIGSGDVPIHFIVCRDAQGHIVHYVLRCTPQKLSLLMQSQTGVVRPEIYASVLASGFGYEPAQSVRQTLKSEYNYDFNALEVVEVD